MEPDGLSTFLAAAIAAMSGIVGEPGAQNFDLQAGSAGQPPALTISGMGRSINLGPGDLSAVRLEVEPQPALIIRFEAEGAAWMAETTTMALGQPLVLSVCGQQVAAPIVHEPITGGEVMISGAFDSETLTGIAGLISGQVLCPIPAGQK
ncbi:MAG: hypothetical protein AAGA70_01365 [Pseudomonadota bacterium]